MVGDLSVSAAGLRQGEVGVFEGQWGQGIGQKPQGAKKEEEEEDETEACGGDKARRWWWLNMSGLQACRGHQVD